MTVPSMIPLSPSRVVAWGSRLIASPQGREWPTNGVEFVHFLGYHAHYDAATGRSSWPIPLRNSCAGLVRFAESRGILSAEPPAAGEIFLIWSEVEQRFMRAGFVAFVARAESWPGGARFFACHTIEAYSPGHSRNGGFAKDRRKLSPECGDRFVRWAELEGRGGERDAVGGSGEFMAHR